MKYTELHLHTYYSVLDGLSSPEQLAKQAKKLGMTHLGITDHGVVDGIIHFQEACEAEGIIPVLGTEFYIVEDMHDKPKKENRKHLCAYAKSDKGMQNIMKMLTIANLEGFHRRPRIDVKTLLANCEDIVVATACLGSFTTEGWGKRLFKSLHEKIGEDLYCELHFNKWDGQEEHNQMLYKQAQKMGVKCTVANDVHYCLSSDVLNHEMLLCISTKNTWNNPDRWKFQSDTHYLKTGEQMLNASEEMGTAIPRDFVIEAIGNTQEICDKCAGVRVEQKPINLPLIPQLNEGEEAEFFKGVVKEGFKKVVLEGDYFSNLPQSEQNELKKVYVARLKEEFDLIESKGFIRYFLIVWELINWCKENDVATGPGRGSVGGSLVAYCAGITRLADPIRHGLLFERFLSESRMDMPDIDLDFDRDKRYMAIEHLQELYGKDYVSNISTFLYLKSKSAFKAVCRAFELNPHETNKLTKEIPDGVDVNEDNIHEFEALHYFAKQNPEIMRFTYAMEGVISAYGKHAAGICISSTPLNNGVNGVLCMRNGSQTLNWPKEYVEEQGIIKLDVLGLSEMGIISDCFKMIKQNHDVELDMEDIPIDDDNVFKMLSRGRTTGVFQLSGWTATKVTKELKIDSFEDIMVVNSIARPGPDSDEIIKRKKRGRWKRWDNDVDLILDETWGMIIYQEQVMQIFNLIAGFTKVKTEKMRKIVAKTLGAIEMNKYKADFIDGCRDTKIVNKTQADKLWVDIVEFSRYAFNKSHCCSYSYISYINSWLKVNYPTEFFACVLSYAGDDKTNLVMEEAIKYSNVQVMLPKIEVSHATKWGAKDGVLYAPFKSISGIGPKLAEIIGDYKEAVNPTFFDLGYDSSSLPTKAIKLLDEIKGFDKDARLTGMELRNANDLFPFNLLLLDK